jgi:trimethylamine--corrinoid protein Co-methyltransferase
MSRANQAHWKAEGSRRIEEAAADRLSQRLAAYEKPEIDPDMENELSSYVTNRKAGKTGCAAKNA